MDSDILQNILQGSLIALTPAVIVGGIAAYVQIKIIAEKMSSIEQYMREQFVNIKHDVEKHDVRIRHLENTIREN